eukprot:233264-Amphidinium_carterae.1
MCVVISRLQWVEPFVCPPHTSIHTAIEPSQQASVGSSNPGLAGRYRGSRMWFGKPQHELSAFDDDAMQPIKLATRKRQQLDVSL